MLQCQSVSVFLSAFLRFLFLYVPLIKIIFFTYLSMYTILTYRYVPQNNCFFKIKLVIIEILPTGNACVQRKSFHKHSCFLSLVLTNSLRSIINDVICLWFIYRNDMTHNLTYKYSPIVHKKY